MEKKDYFNIPNLMGYFRILMLPVFLVLYYRADSFGDYLVAFLVLGISLLTDLFDGKIARKLNMVTEWGKVLDPVADKLTQGALALALASHYPVMLGFLLLFLVRETYMAVMGLYLIKKGKGVYGAQMYGKVCTTVIDIGVFLLLLFPGLSFTAGNMLILIMDGVVVVTWIKYVIFHVAALKDREVKKVKRSHLLYLLLTVTVYLLAGAVIPYITYPEISEEYRNSFKTGNYYGEGEFADRATIIEDNREALEERIRLIESAQERIVMSTFDFTADISGMQILAALKAAAERGVQVQVLVDGFNSTLDMNGNPYFYALAAEENAEIRVYNPVNLLTPWKGMSRMHDKYLVADEKLYILGGRNTNDLFLGDRPGDRNYDRDVLVYNTGDGSSSLYQVLDYFEGVWNLKCSKRWHDSTRISELASVRRASQELTELYETMREDYSDWFCMVDYRERTVPTEKITLLSNPTHLYAKEPQVFYGLSRLIGEAEQEVLIHTPYIMCNDMMYETFRQLCETGADITMMTNSSLNNGNPFGAVDYALNKDKVLATGLRILEYEGGISYHGKSLVIDHDLAIVGSFNMDMKSVYQDTELMLVIDSGEVNAQLREYLESYECDTQEASADSAGIKTLFGKNVPFIVKIESFFIMLLDPWLRFIL